MTEARFEPERIFETLARHEVDYVVIGAMAALLQGASLTMTLDVDVSAAHDHTNRERLAAALDDMGARLRPPDPTDEVVVPLDARMLANISVVTCVTRFGPFDILFAPAGVAAYEDLRARARQVERFGVTIKVADIGDIVAMKRAAGREKDAEHLTVLLNFVEEQRSDSQQE